ncbi:GMP synthase [glutamine-hydrolyzing], amidotransferase subunit [Candidatus Rhodobacter oscarellae]|uniref:GMP synthase [glutamine-hydrolyzing], amidotransferase subunit n=1 Tax=Candidatus Rhodobacter oscarellae TaxID=1675527 RepID=A0A0J9H0C9_9RHOB|nr:type 1 glutamine amidotransferase [Candidatus Rhodobacter lobularis]KMW59193.1 GMP synthase [glutamine-hydrolyzing], amidotransferase subunit [Candidatus Rhodobacter lobularis]
MKLTVYDCLSPDKLTAKYGPTGNHVIRWIAPHLPEADLESLHIAGDLPPKAPGETDGIIISGSEKGVYDDTPWMQPLRENILAHRAHGTPIFGICFGHQIMADVLGGKAEKVDQGFITGARRFDMAGAETPAYVAHQDQVTKAPPGATVTASAPYCPVAALAYDDFPALSVQFHPEYDAGFTEDLIDLFGSTLMTAEQIAEAKASITGDVPRDLYAAEVAAFFRGHLS